jgi:hypothetical protein
MQISILRLSTGTDRRYNSAGDLRRKYGGKFRKYLLFLAAAVGGLGIALLIEAFFNRN